MQIPDFNCKIDAFCVINPSEDPSKVKEAISNVLPNIEIQSSKDSIKATSQNLETLTNIFDAINSRRIHRVYRRCLNKNRSEDSTWFYLNKQAALANTIVLCDEPEESPLGPIKIILTSKWIEQIIDWLVLKDE